VLNQQTENTAQNSDVVWRKLTLSLNHSPQDLKLLTQRILFCLDNHLSEFAAGALQDLFIVLQHKGADLRLRMLNLINPLLDYSERKYFQQKLAIESESSSQLSQECQHFIGSVLAEGDCELSETSYLSKASEFQSKQEEAHYLIACGKLFAARELLEETYLKNKSDTVTESELQSFYFYAKDKKGLEQFMAKLLQNNNEVSSSWQALQKAAAIW
jgi:hypothetical protein